MQTEEKWKRKIQEKSVRTFRLLMEYTGDAGVSILGTGNRLRKDEKTSSGYGADSRRALSMGCSNGYIVLSWRFHKDEHVWALV
jgi:hypothetical protein